MNIEYLLKGRITKPIKLLPAVTKLKMASYFLGMHMSSELVHYQCIVVITINN